MRKLEMALIVMAHRLLNLESDRLENEQQREMVTPSYPAAKQSAPTNAVGITPARKPFTKLTSKIQYQQFHLISVSSQP